MAKIQIKEPEGPYSATLDTEAMQVTITEAFLGVGFVAPSGEKLSVCMRDGGFEIQYRYGEIESQWMELKDGDMSVGVTNNA